MSEHTKASPERIVVNVFDSNSAAATVAFDDVNRLHIVAGVRSLTLAVTNPIARHMMPEVLYQPNTPVEIPTEVLECANSENPYLATPRRLMIFGNYIREVSNTAQQILHYGLFSICIDDKNIPLSLTLCTGPPPEPGETTSPEAVARHIEKIISKAQVPLTVDSMLATFSSRIKQRDQLRAMIVKDLLRLHEEGVIVADIAEATTIVAFRKKPPENSTLYG